MILNSSKPTNFRWFIIGIIFFITIVNYIDRSAVAFSLSHLKAAFSLSSAELGLILGGFGIGYAVTTFLGGIWVDKLGAKKIMAITVLLWAFSMFSMAATFGFVLMFLSRILLGVAEGPNFPALTRSVADWLPEKERVTALAYSLMAVPIALALGGPIITQLIIYFSWRGMFLILGAIALLWLPVWLYYFKNNPKNSKQVNKPELDFIVNTHPTDLTTSHTLPKEIWRYLFTNPTLLANYFAFFVFGYFLFFFMSWLPNYLSIVYHMNLTNEGIFTMLPWLTAAVFMFIIGKLSDFIAKKTSKLRYSRSYPIMISQLLASLCIIPLVIMVHPHLILTIILISLAVGFSMGANPAYYAINIDIAKQRAATALGIMDTGFAIAGFIAPVLTGYLVSITGTFAAGFSLLIILGLLSVILVALFHNPDKYLASVADY